MVKSKNRTFEDKENHFLANLCPPTEKYFNFKHVMPLITYSIKTKID